MGFRMGRARRQSPTTTAVRAPRLLVAIQSWTKPVAGHRIQSQRVLNLHPIRILSQTHQRATPVSPNLSGRTKHLKAVPLRGSPDLSRDPGSLTRVGKVWKIKGSIKQTPKSNPEIGVAAAVEAAALREMDARTPHLVLPIRRQVSRWRRKIGQFLASTLEPNPARPPIKRMHNQNQPQSRVESVPRLSGLFNQGKSGSSQKPSGKPDRQC